MTYAEADKLLTFKDYKCYRLFSSWGNGAFLVREGWLIHGVAAGNKTRALRDIAELLHWGDMEVADFYNYTFGTSHPCPIQKHLKDPQARLLFEAMTKRLAERDRRRAA